MRCVEGAMNPPSIPVFIAATTSSESLHAIELEATDEPTAPDITNDVADTIPGQPAALACHDDEDTLDTCDGVEDAPDDTIDTISDSMIEAFEDDDASTEVPEQASRVHAVARDVRENGQARPAPLEPPPPPLSAAGDEHDSDETARDSMSAVWMASARRGAKPPRAFVGASTILCFALTVIGVAASGVAALALATPDVPTGVRVSSATSAIHTPSIVTSPLLEPPSAPMPTLPAKPSAPAAMQPSSTAAKQVSPPTTAPIRSASTPAKAPPRAAPRVADHTRPSMTKSPY